MAEGTSAGNRVLVRVGWEPSGHGSSGDKEIRRDRIIMKWRIWVKDDKLKDEVLHITGKKIYISKCIKAI